MSAEDREWLAEILREQKKISKNVHDAAQIQIGLLLIIGLMIYFV